MSTTTPVKNYFDGKLATLLATKIIEAYPAFDSEAFVATVEQQVEPLELKARVAVISAALRDHLPTDYGAAVDVLLAILGPENPGETGMFTEGYWLMPVAHFVEVYGLEEFERSIAAIYEITKRHTGEYAVRPYLVRYPERMLAVMGQWATDPSFHVRRLASEGVRPRLPWAKKLDQFIADPQPMLAILERLKADPSAFVRKSVANGLNDVLKDNYEIGMTVVRRWAEEDAPETRWIVKHALRHQRKKGNAEAIAISQTL